MCDSCVRNLGALYAHTPGVMGDVLIEPQRWLHGVWDELFAEVACTLKGLFFLGLQIVAFVPLGVATFLSYLLGLVGVALKFCSCDAEMNTALQVALAGDDVPAVRVLSVQGAQHPREAGRALKRALRTGDEALLRAVVPLVPPIAIVREAHQAALRNRYESLRLLHCVGALGTINRSDLFTIAARRSHIETVRTLAEIDPGMAQAGLSEAIKDDRAHAVRVYLQAGVSFHPQRYSVGEWFGELAVKPASSRALCELLKGGMRIEEIRLADALSPPSIRCFLRAYARYGSSAPASFREEVARHCIGWLDEAIDALLTTDVDKAGLSLSEMISWGHVASILFRLGVSSYRLYTKQFFRDASERQIARMGLLTNVSLTRCVLPIFTPFMKFPLFDAQHALDFAVMHGNQVLIKRLEKKGARVRHVELQHARSFIDYLCGVESSGLSLYNRERYLPVIVNNVYVRILQGFCKRNPDHIVPAISELGQFIAKYEPAARKELLEQLKALCAQWGVLLPVLLPLVVDYYSFTPGWRLVTEGGRRLYLE